MTDEPTGDEALFGGEPMVPAPDMLLVDSHDVQAAVVYPDGLGAVLVTITGRVNASSTRRDLHLTLDPAEAIALSAHLRDAYLRVPLDKRHAR